MIKLLFWLFRKQFIELAFKTQSKPIDFTELDFCFIDSKGRRYYKFPDGKEQPLVRKAYFEKCFQELSCSLHDSELSLILDAFDKAFNGKDKAGKQFVDIAMIGHLIKELRDRKELLLHPDIFMDMICVRYIREDENPLKFDAQIHNQKIEQLTIDSKREGGLWYFFQMAGLEKFIPFSHSYVEEFNKLIQDGKIRVEALKQQLESYISEK